jgi:H+/Cl- antiporter ClcA
MNVQNMDVKNFFNRTFARLKSYGFNLILLSVITGLFAGTVVTLYNIATSYGENCARELYSLILANPAFIPLLLLGLAAGAIVIGTLVKFVPMIRGSGIPQIEGAARGIFRFKWYVVMCSMFAASLACVFMGLSAGSEGPSLEIGGCAGDAVGTALKRSQMIKRLQIAGGASAGFAVAFNAPITGMVFALEEAFHSFSPQAFICSATSVITALLVRNGMRSAMGMHIGFSFDNFVFAEIPLSSYCYVALAALIVALAAVVFYYLMLLTKKLFKKVTFFKGTGKFIIPFVLAGAFGLITLYSIGGGHSFIDALSTGGSGEINIERVFGLGVCASLVIIVIIRFISMVVYMGCGVPCGVFIPMLAVGAGLGAILSLAFRGIGFEGIYSDYLVIICMAVFFTTFVRAPITGICMVFELTGQFQNFLPALLGITIGYAVSEMCRLQPGYEKLLSMFVEEEGYLKNVRKVHVSVTIQSGSQADGGKVRKIIWPAHGLIVGVTGPDGKTLIPDGTTTLTAGDVIQFECDTSDEKQLMEYLYEIVGKPQDPKK